MKRVYKQGTRLRTEKLVSLTRSGFSLIEVIAVVVILAIAASATAGLLRWPVRKSRRHLDVVQVQDFDKRLRVLCNRMGPQVLRVDCSKQVLELLEVEDPNLPPVAELRLDTALMRRVLVQGDHAPRDRADILFHSPGVSMTYAIELISNRQEAEWVIFLGMSGQSFRVAGEMPSIHRFLNVQL